MYHENNRKELVFSINSLSSTKRVMNAPITVCSFLILWQGLQINAIFQSNDRKRAALQRLQIKFVLELISFNC